MIKSEQCIIRVHSLHWEASDSCFSLFIGKHTPRLSLGVYPEISPCWLKAVIKLAPVKNMISLNYWDSLGCGQSQIKMFPLKRNLRTNHSRGFRHYTPGSLCYLVTDFSLYLARCRHFATNSVRTLRAFTGSLRKICNFSDVHKSQTPVPHL